MSTFEHMLSILEQLIKLRGHVDPHELEAEINRLKLEGNVTLVAMVNNSTSVQWHHAAPTYEALRSLCVGYRLHILPHQQSF